MALKTYLKDPSPLQNTAESWLRLDRIRGWTTTFFWPLTLPFLEWGPLHDPSMVSPSNYITRHQWYSTGF